MCRRHGRRHGLLAHRRPTFGDRRKTEKPIGNDYQIGQLVEAARATSDVAEGTRRLSVSEHA
jgi:hypothetical protein